MCVVSPAPIATTVSATGVRRSTVSSGLPTNQSFSISPANAALPPGA
ncbi:MAG: hypothetical protein AVDCRST_MAG59-472 [uncultured Thermomicrobiales bacterium]|uniref:Uncharacterized protein n=1 Tax=uncultured Thermomicrobiales bacterium TaxID=1645740 RepID=A0A6J4U0K3_9BACT|nr:MAG: hypothetical protein AVDCRST_MAG59-472 [uncultured Thermomicrobiales bacterium]